MTVIENHKSIEMLLKSGAAIRQSVDVSVGFLVIEDFDHVNAVYLNVCAASIISHA